jgi:cephalosporin hydroxylase
VTDIEFDERNKTVIRAMGADAELRDVTQSWFETSYQHEYSYHFKWMGLPIIQYPQDIVAVQEIVWSLKPDAIIETGIARGGSLIFYSSLFEMMGTDGVVVGVDIDIREPNRRGIEEHPMSKRIHMVEGSSVDAGVISEVAAAVDGRESVLVILDSNHTHEHVLAELELYSQFVTPGSYLIVFDTIVEHMPEGTYPDRPWGKGDNPLSAVREFLNSDARFEVDSDITDKLLITAAPGGYLRRRQSR